MTDPREPDAAEALTRRAVREGGARRAPSSASGIRGAIAKHPTVWLVSAMAAAFLLLATGAVAAGVAAGSGGSAQAVSPPSESASALPPRPQPSAMPTASQLRTCSVAGPAADGNLGTLAASVVNANSGEVLFDRDGATGHSTASVMKLLTAASAVQMLGAGTQFSTRVIDGSAPGTIVLVGGGDPTLATTPNSFYEGAPQIADLAATAMAKYTALHPKEKDKIKQIVLDSTLWDTADNWEPSWPESDRTDGYQSLITALMVDGDRDDPTQSVSPRGTDPIARAGQAFAAAAGLDGVTFSRGSAVGSTVLAEVKSQPVSTLVSQMLLTSDNTLAETLARATATAQGQPGVFSSLQQAIVGPLKALGMSGADTLVIKDGSGESADNSVPPLFVAQLLVKIRANEKGLGVVYSGMPVGGESGDLEDRFTGANEIAAGKVVAKPGWIDNERSLAGVVTAADGTPLAFAFYGLGEAISYDTRLALDTLTTAIYTCGNNLSNN